MFINKSYVIKIYIDYRKKWAYDHVYMNHSGGIPEKVIMHY